MTQGSPALRSNPGLKDGTQLEFKTDNDSQPLCQSGRVRMNSSAWDGRRCCDSAEPRSGAPLCEAQYFEGRKPLLKLYASLLTQRVKFVRCFKAYR